MTTKKILLIVGGVVVVLGFLVVCFVAGIVGFALYQVGNSQAALKAKDFLRNSEKLKAQVGDVKDFGSIVTGSVNLDSSGGQATLHLKVIGERETVNANVDLTLVSGGAWRVSSASYVNASGQTIDLLDPYDTQLLIPLFSCMTESSEISQGVAILGSTGSIGCNSLRVIESLTARRMRVVALAAGTNVERLADQIATHLPEIVSVDTEAAAHDLRAMLFARDVDLPRIVVGEAGLVEVATHPDAQCVISATVGAVGFVPTLKALELGKRVALANKETLVMAGELMTNAAKKSGAELLPVDSEHNALHQCLRGERREEVRRIILTASGGPFRTKNRAEMSLATVSEAMQHPTWNMGAKITIDSATLMNKGLEVIEAHWLFGFGPDAIDILVHPQSVVHSMIEMIDGSVIAQMGVTDMRHAIQYALTYPERHSCQLPPLDLTSISGLHFEPPDHDRFPCIKLAYRALREGGTLPAAMNAANEEAVAAFLNERICLTEIPQVIETVMNEHEKQPAKDIQTILDADHEARLAALACIEGIHPQITQIS